MIKKYCDRCGKEIKQGTVSFEGILQRKYSLMIPVKGKALLPAERVEVRKIHLCQDCIADFEKWLKEKKKET